MFQKMLFCFANSKVGGGNRILLELANRLKQAGNDISLLFSDRSGSPGWFQNGCPVLECDFEKLSELTDVSLSSFDFVFASNASLVPALAAVVDIRKIVLICQGFESYCYGETPQELFASKPALEAIIKLPISVIATSKSIQTLLLEKLNVESYLVPVAIDPSQFVYERGETADGQSDVTSQVMPMRILAVGDYANRFKGIFDVADALDIIAPEFSVQLVVLTQQRSGRKQFKKYSFPVEFNYVPAQSTLGKLYSSCTAYCCGSWYEGFGLPCLESFAAGIPVISTNNLGVNEFARDGENMLLCEINSPESMAEKLRKLLGDSKLQQKLVDNGRSSLQDYSWSNTIDHFTLSLQQIRTAEPAKQHNSVTSEELRSLLNDLEEEGFHTPPLVENVLRTSSALLTELLEQVKNNLVSDALATEKLTELRTNFRAHLTNPKAHYYNQFKARFDLCQLLSICATPQDWSKIVRSDHLH